MPTHTQATTSKTPTPVVSDAALAADDDPTGTDDFGAAMVVSAASAEVVSSARDEEDEAQYKDDDLVTVLHGYGRVRAAERSWIGGKAVVGKPVRTYERLGGVVRNVRYEDAKHWRETFVDEQGRSAIIILPRNASPTEFARRAGIQPTNLPKLIAMLEAANIPDLVQVWGVENVLAYCNRLTQQIAATQQAQGILR